ncbi:Glycosyl hydrolase family 98, putative carbohydrate binding module (plasmid) [Deinococcus geothermalis DSM 11300]|uniref:Glycosyl hydrolase family 98, putative carbohydrate binding module n=2 Tax=Deinococcus geothermalis TaxID=68909 RepID=Q1J336_DEIGD|nr:Glycosyl hydrolase family 98, putative carbohydrate binding module [Deinococcus geothermalis DSM 11300]
MKSPVRLISSAMLLLGTLLGLGACTDGGTPAASDPYAGGVSYPWTDQTPTPADPYASGISYPWTGPSAASLQPAGLSGDNSLSDLSWTPGSAANAWGPIELNRSNGEKNAGDGRTLTIGGQSFPKGLGMHANGEVSYATGGSCSTFTATVGIDDEVGDRGSVVFEVWDGTTTRLYATPILRGSDPPFNLTVPLTRPDGSAVRDLRLVVRDAGDGISYDHADWANPTLSCSATPPSGDVFVSDLDWNTPSNGWGPIEQDLSNGEKGLADGRTLTIGGQSFPKGLGMHANGSVTYLLGGRCSTFTASVGVDDEVGDRGSVVFQVFGDGTKLYDSGVRRGTDGPQALNVNVSGVQQLKLVVTDAGDSISYDHADWANAKLSCSSDTNTLTYTPIADQPYVVAEAMGQVVRGKLYTFGGFDSLKSGFTPTDRAYVYDPDANTWTPIARMPNRGATHAGMTTDGTDIFYAGGYVADANWTGQVFGSKEVWRYNVASNTYTRLPDLPVARAAGGLEYLNGKLHYFGGTNLSRQDVGDHFVLDLAGGATSWTTAAPLPNPRNHLGAAVLGGKIYAVGGARGQDQNSVQQTAVHAYDPATNTWTAVASLPRGLSHNADTTFVLGGRIIVAGGEVAYNVSTRDVTAYNPATNTWTPLTPLPIGREASVADALGNGFLYTGGNQPGWVKSGWRAMPQAASSQP